MNLEYEFTYSATLKDPVQIGAGPYGTRLVIEITGGGMDGKRLKGRVLTGGADWFLFGPDGWGRVDVRGQLLTDDGAAIYVAYTGLLEMNPKAQQAVTTGGSTDYGDQYFRTSPRFETGDPRYSWLNHALFVAEGRMAPRAVEYRVYRVT